MKDEIKISAFAQFLLNDMEFISKRIVEQWEYLEQLELRKAQLRHEDYLNYFASAVDRYYYFMNLYNTRKWKRAEKILR